MPVGPEDLGLRGIPHASLVKSPPSVGEEQEVWAVPVFAAR